MELTVRDWMVIVGVLLIVAVLLDAWRRVRNDKRSRVKVDLVDPEKIPSEPDKGIDMFKELPNGGARVVERGDLLQAAAAGRQDAGVEDAADTGDYQDAGQGSNGEDDVQLVEGVSSRDHDNRDHDNMDWLTDTVDEPPEKEAPPAAGKLVRNADPQVFMLNVVARSPQGFKGEDILHILLACDLRFGDMSFFHRHEFEAGRGAIQFSVANMMQPGVFDLDAMDDFRTPGLVFFVTLPGPGDMIKAFDYMLETAQAVARNLDGDVLDESRSVITRQTLEHARQRIRDLERRLLARASG